MKKYQFKASQIPNYISAFRILLVPLYVLLFFGVIGEEWFKHPYFAAGLTFLLAGFSDALDGYLARHNQLFSDIGKLLDPLADKLLEAAVSICIAIEFKGPFVILSAIIITKEIIMIIGAYLMMSKGNIYVSAGWCGKLATIVWYLMICIIHFFPNTAKGHFLITDALCTVLILVMIMAFVIYVFSYASQIQTTKEAIIHSKKNH